MKKKQRTKEEKEVNMSKVGILIFMFGVEEVMLGARRKIQFLSGLKGINQLRFLLFIPMFSLSTLISTSQLPFFLKK